MTPQQLYEEKMREANEIKKQMEASNMATQALWFELRLKCLDLAVRSKETGDNAVAMAKVYEDYVRGHT